MGWLIWNPGGRLQIGGKTVQGKCQPGYALWPMDLIRVYLLAFCLAMSMVRMESLLHFWWFVVRPAGSGLFFFWPELPSIPILVPQCVLQGSPHCSPRYQIGGLWTRRPTFALWLVLGAAALPHCIGGLYVWARQTMHGYAWAKSCPKMKRCAWEYPWWSGHW